ncbi:hypothetical protein QBC39DRAFT_427107 [Podospora conica]|nr:hypothetical protein QBC39DRAFT_427107 [Schizothecium conicum]
MSSETDQNVLVPVKLDAFIFNRAVFDASDNNGKPPQPPPKDPKEKPPQPPKDPEDKPTLAKIAPIVQPNYTFLRLDTDYIQSDILNPIDLHNAWPAEFNSRFTDLGTDKARKRRQGVYVHWTIPRLYRSGIAATKPDPTLTPAPTPTPPVSSLGDDGAKDPVDPTVPAFPNLPTCWLVIRHIADVSTIQPAEARPLIPKFEAWVVDSDYLWKLDKIPAWMDLQTDVSPFISAADGTSVGLAEQAEVFIGRKTKLQDWTDPRKDPNAKRLERFNLVGSSNQLFADYQPHCSNVFSIVDNFEYGSDPKNPKYLAAAEASYYVIGWHADESQDLFFGDQLTVAAGEEKEKPKPKPIKRQQRLDTLKLRIKLDEGLEESKRRKAETVFKDWLQDKGTTRMLCHGAMYNVNWDSGAKPKSVPADTFSKHLNETLPVSVGTTPMDSLLSYAHAHKDIDPAEFARVEKLILNLETHLLARDDGVETQQQALDMLYNWNYVRADGGQAWNIAGPPKGEEESGETMLTTLRELNREQLLLDALERAITRLQRELFYLWWRYVTDRTPRGDKNKDRERDEAVKNRVLCLGKRVDNLVGRRDACRANIIKWSATESLQAGARPSFYQQRDPTLLVGGIKSGWPHDYLDTLQVRVDSQILAPKAPTSPFASPKGDPLDKLPLASTMKRLIAEFLILNPKTTPGNPVLEDVQETPLFHDNLAGEKLHGVWRDRWEDTQPWFPLFLEWEIEYFHIPYDKWTLESRDSLSSTASQLRYGIPRDTNLMEPRNTDRHLIEGRSLILPQPNFSLEAKIKQLFSSTPSGVLGDEKSKFPNLDERTELQRDLHKLAFLSAPLAGLTAHLTTLLQGSHIKPNLRDGTSGLVYPVDEAMRLDAGFDNKHLAHIGIETDSTPFGTEKKPALKADEPLFKPATHGQFRFRRLNIIDKFGQAIHAIDPALGPPDKRQKVWPCIGEWYAPQIWGGDPKGRAPNVVDREVIKADDKPKPQRCEFIQIPPQINQLSRLNSVFVKPDPDYPQLGPPFWKPADEWENPIWGWVVVNYANLGIQLFLRDGTFYREVRKAGPLGSQTEPEWLPFNPPTSHDLQPDRNIRQLQLLVQKLGNHTYLSLFWDMLVVATGHMQPAPDAYASFANALIGRPLALVHVGWSLELAGDELTTQAAGDAAPPWVLLPPKSDEDKKRDNCGAAPPPGPPKKPKRYTFPIQIGDPQRGFDGLAAYFHVRPSFPSSNPTQDLDLGLDLTTILSHYPPSTPHVGIAKPPLLPLQAHWINPEAYTTADAFARARNAELRVVGALMDPFAPVHGYSGVLPVRELSLPPWTWQGAMAKMKAFFHVGPVVVAGEGMPPGKMPAAAAVAGDGGDVVAPPGEGTAAVGLPSVAGAAGDWVWLQPYVPEVEKKGEEARERFGVLPVRGVDERARGEEGPYEALEGYLMMVARREEGGEERKEEMSR